MVFGSEKAKLKFGVCTAGGCGGGRDTGRQAGRGQCKGRWTRRYREIAGDTDRSETSNHPQATHSVGEIKSQVTGSNMRQHKRIVSFLTFQLVVRRG